MVFEKTNLRVLIKFMFWVWIATIVAFVVFMVFAPNEHVTVPGSDSQITPFGRVVTFDVLLGILAFTLMVFLKATKNRRLVPVFILTFLMSAVLVIFGIPTGDGKPLTEQNIQNSEKTMVEATISATPIISPKRQGQKTKEIIYKTGDMLPNGKIYVDPNNLPRISNSNVLNLVNLYRSKNGLVPWEVSSELCALAERRASFLFANDMEQAYKANAGSHPGFNEMTAEYAMNGWIGENISNNPLTDEKAFKSWVDSPPHEAMLHWDWVEGSHITKACVANRVGVDGSIVVLLAGYK